MRMWMIDPKLLCNKHLMGEHFEIHKHRHNFVKGHSVKGRLNPIVQIEPISMEERHNSLVLEIKDRGMNHKSPYEQPDLSSYGKEVLNAKVDQRESIKDLCKRCEKCRKIIVEK